MRKIKNFNPKQEEIYRILEKMGHPEREGINFHIVGTNGKGSSGRLLALALEKLTGKPCGHFSSPHVHKYEERIMINSKPIRTERLLEIRSNLDKVYKNDQTGMAGYFSQSFLEAMEAFRTCDYRIVEAGIGGREDVTNVIPSKLKLITSIGRDHENILGPYPQGITENKADVMEDGGFAISCKQRDEVRDILLNKAGKMGAHFIFAPPIDEFKIEWPEEKAGGNQSPNRLSDKEGRSTWGMERSPYLNYPLMSFKYNGGFLSGDYKSRLIGRHQLANFSLALRALEFILENRGDYFEEADLPGAEEIKQIVKETVFDLYLPGRMELICQEPILFIDGAHNDPAVDLLLENKKLLSACEGMENKDWILFFGMHKEKIHPDRLEKLLGSFSAVYHIGVEGQSDSQIIEEADLRVREALTANKDAVFLAAGSFYILDGIGRAFSDYEIFY